MTNIINLDEKRAIKFCQQIQSGLEAMAGKPSLYDRAEHCASLEAYNNEHVCSLRDIDVARDHATAQAYKTAITDMDELFKLKNTPQARFYKKYIRPLWVKYL